MELRQYSQPLDEVYDKARAQGKIELLCARIRGKEGHLPTLEKILPSYNGIIDPKPFFTMIYPQRIYGTYSVCRGWNFSCGFMPLPKPEKGDFATKWKKTYQNRMLWMETNAIDVLEFFHHYYVFRDGNKRASVAKYEKLSLIKAKISRVYPDFDIPDPRVQEFYEFLRFEKNTGISSLWFTTPGNYGRLEDVLSSVDLPHELISTFFKAVKKQYSSYGELFLSFCDYLQIKDGRKDDPKEIKKAMCQAEKLLKKTSHKKSCIETYK
jgi:hypothetical protein